MISINLLPIEHKEKIKVAKQNLGFLIVCLSISIVLAIIIIVLISAQYTLKISIDSVENNIKGIENQLNSSGSIRNNVYFIKDRLAELKNLKNNKTAWSEYLKTLVKTTPDGITLTGFNITAKTAPEVKITGNCNSKNDVAVFKANLEASPYFKNVVFESSKKNTKDNIEYTDFALTLELEKK